MLSPQLGDHRERAGDHRVICRSNAGRLVRKVVKKAAGNADAFTPLGAVGESIEDVGRVHEQPAKEPKLRGGQVAALAALIAKRQEEHAQCFPYLRRQHDALLRRHPARIIEGPIHGGQ